MDKKPMDFTGMKPSDALAKAHEFFPEIRWEWSAATVEDYCGCAAALLCIAANVEDGTTNSLDKIFPILAGCYAGEVLGGERTAWERISATTIRARSFPEAIELLRERGW